MVQSGSPALGLTGHSQFPPLNFFYTHFHNSIKAELESLASWVVNLERAEQHGLLPKLVELRERYRFLEQVYKYHSSVEDEVVYPALDAKVKNVTVAYRVEHQDEELLLEQLAHLINEAMSQGGADQTETIRGLICKVEEIHRTLKKHLAKEEEQLLPLLLQNFSFPEQAGLVAQFLYCIPLTMVGRVLAWLKPHVPEVEQDELLHHIRCVVADDLLVQLLTSWLQSPDQLAASNAASSRLPPAATSQDDASCSHCHQQPCGSGVSGPANKRPPIKEIIHIHRTICHALGEFASETRSLQQRSDVTAAQLGHLVDRHRFLRSVCMFHTISEEEVMYPEVRRLSTSDPLLAAPGGAGEGAQAACSQCEQEHESEVAAMEELGRLLADVRAFARRGRKEVSQMLTRLSASAEQVLSSISKHMAREETEVFPLLERHLCVHRQRAMVWRTLTAMPLRLLERVLPFVTAALSEEDTQELLNNIRLGCPEPGSALVELLLRWAERGRGAAGAAGQPAAPQDSQAVTQQGAVGHDASTFLQEYVDLGHPGLLPVVPGSFVRTSTSGTPVGCSSGLHGADDTEPPQKKAKRTEQAGPGQLSVPIVASCCCNSPAAPAQGMEQQGVGSMSEPGSSDMLIDGVSPQAHTGPAGALQTSPSVFSQPTTREHSPVDTAPTTTATAFAPSAAAPAATHFAQAGAGRSSPKVTPDPKRNPFNPIDHIFQFHQALRQELKQLEADALNVERAVMAHIQDQSSGQAPGPATQAPAAAALATAPPATDQQQPPSPAVAAAKESTAGGQGNAPLGTVAATPTACAPQQADAPVPPRPVTPNSALLPHTDTLPAPVSATEVDPLELGKGSPLALTKVATSAAHPPAEPPSALWRSQNNNSPGTPAAANSATAGSLSASAYMSRLPKRVGAALQALDGRFQFLWGIYRAHSRSEDEIVFPALESKHALRNVSHAYTLDHQQEEQLFLDLEQVIDSLRRCEGNSQAAREAALAVRRMCAAVRASLETHIRAEEAELWPLFTEHFTYEEQQYLVGVIIGRTGAQVLQTLLPWISESFTVEEQEVVLGSLRQATKNTMFDQWLEAISHQPPAPITASSDDSTHGPDGSTGMARAGSTSGSQQAGLLQDTSLPDPELARYLTDTATGNPAGTPAAAAAGHPAVSLPTSSPQAYALAVTREAHTAAAGTTDSSSDTGVAADSGAGAAGTVVATSGATVESSTFRPGWEDIFRMNQKQLEAAVMRVSADPNLEPGRKAYLIQNIMVSKYIVAQQRRMQEELLGGPAPCGLASGAAEAAAPASQAPEGLQALLQGAGGVVQPRKTYYDAAHGILGCKHYRRKAQLVAPCCQKVFTCRLCHDEAVSHRMDRYAVTHMVCMACGTEQPVAGQCNTCATQLARYYCNICHLFDDEPDRPIYHCPFCNVCRRGRGLGIDFFHCMSCNSCMSLSLFKSHTCREKAMESNCPVCSEYLFDSADPIKELPCGHLLHSRCFAEYTRYNYTCPLCSKSVGDMSVYFQMLDSLLASERLPPEYAGRMQQVLCNDCGKTGFARFHFAYHSCPHCRSYNTRVM